ncbi:MAG: OsmC family protein [Acidimicrobiia bacterium]
MSTSTKRINDVNLEAVGGLAEAILDKPEIADTVWKASVEWKGGFRTEARVRDFGPVPSDEPLSLGGDDTAPNPVEQVLAALGNCLAVGYAANASAAGIELDALRIELEGDLDLHTFLGLADDNAGYKTIEVKVSVESDATPAQIEELHDRVVSTSPVGHTLQRPIPVSVLLA